MGRLVTCALVTHTLPHARLEEPPGPRLRTPCRVVDAGREMSETGLHTVSVPIQIRDHGRLKQ